MKQTTLREQWEQFIEQKKAQKLAEVKKEKKEKAPVNSKEVPKIENSEPVKSVRKRRKKILDDDDD